MRRSSSTLLNSASRLFFLFTGLALDLLPGYGFAQVSFVDQGPNWTSATRSIYYSQDQGSRIAPYSWIKALKLTDKKEDNRGFLDDGLARYGYIANPDSPTPGLPIGFLKAKTGKEEYLSMTCSACHNRQIEVDGVSWRIDGGPAITDFQSFLSDIRNGFAHILDKDNDTAFNDFAQNVLGASYNDSSRNQLRREVNDWFIPYNAIIAKSLPANSWGPVRADAVSMIFNRLVGLDIGPPPYRIIEKNILLADAPVRYPFIWNASRHDTIQWPGFASNGDDILALARNVGEVFGVFGVFHPTQIFSNLNEIGDLLGKKNFPVIIDFMKDSSLNFPGLQKQEEMIKKIGSPKWPWTLDSDLVAKGMKIFNRDPDNGGCAKGCHEVAQGTPRVCNMQTWATPLQDVGTDSREYSILYRKAETGVLKNTSLPIPGFDQPLSDSEKAIKILGVSVIGSILQAPLHFGLDVFQPILEACLNADQQRLSRVEIVKLLAAKFSNALANLYQAPTDPNTIKYEARVMEGIWAAAPYLHNGSVPTLADLLKPSSQRPGSFAIGPEYDIKSVGLSKNQSKSSYVYQTTDCDNRNSGNSRCGHEFGVNLTDDEKKALLEYLKSL